MVEGNLSKRARQLLIRKGFPLIYLHRCEDDLSSFENALANVVDHNPRGAYVDKHTSDELREDGATVFLSRNKMAGIAVWPDGNIGAAFNDIHSGYKNASGELMLTALSAQGTKLDCYNGPLRRIYSKFGFIPVARVKFDRNFAPKNWKAEFKEPDVIFWMHCGDSVETVAENIGKYPTYKDKDIEKLRCFGSYEEAYKYRDALIENKQEDL